MSLTIPGPSNLKISFGNRAEFLAASIPSAINYVLAGGLMFVRDATGTAATTSDGAKWSPAHIVTPLHWGAVGDGVADDAAPINAMLTWAAADRPVTGLIGPKVVIDFLGLQYGIGSSIVFPSGIKGGVIRAGSFIPIGTWTSTAYMVTNHASYTTFYDMSLNGDKKARCWDDSSSSGRCRMYNTQIYRGTDIGYHKTGGGGETRWFGGQITEYLPSDPEFADQSNFEMTGMLIEESDCKFHGTNIRWTNTCFQWTTGVQWLYDCHFVQGTAGAYARTNGRLIYHAAGDTGELFTSGCYFDNGYCEFRGTDKVNLDGIVVLDSADADVATFFQFYARTASTPECRATASLTFNQWDDTCDLFGWIDEGGNAWADDYSRIVARLSGVLASGGHVARTITLNNIGEVVATNADGAGMAVTSNNLRSYVTFQDRNTSAGGADFGSQGDHARVSSSKTLLANVPGVTLTAQSAEPTADDGTLSISDGTASTNGYGTAGAGLYLRTGGTWAKL